MDQCQPELIPGVKQDLGSSLAEEEEEEAYFSHG